MNIFDVLSLIGGLCLFLFGTNIMGSALERISDHCSNIALSTLDGQKHMLHAHSSPTRMKIPIRCTTKFLKKNTCPEL